MPTGSFKIEADEKYREQSIDEGDREHITDEEEEEREHTTDEEAREHTTDGGDREYVRWGTCAKVYMSTGCSPPRECSMSAKKTAESYMCLANASCTSCCNWLQCSAGTAMMSKCNYHKEILNDKTQTIVLRIQDLRACDTRPLRD